MEKIRALFTLTEILFVSVYAAAVVSIFLHNDPSQWIPGIVCFALAFVVTSVLVMRLYKAKNRLERKGGVRWERSVLK